MTKQQCFALLCSLGMMGSVAASDTLVESLAKCDQTFYVTMGIDRQIAEDMKVRQDKLAFFKTNGTRLTEVAFAKPIKDSGITLTGYIVNDSIQRYFGVPDMHAHFWGFTVKEDWMTVVERLKLDWQSVDANHKTAHTKNYLRENGQDQWVRYVRPQERDMPEFGKVEKTFNVAPYKNGSMIFCSMQSAGAPDEAILLDVRPDLIWQIQAYEAKEKAEK